MRYCFTWCIFRLPHFTDYGPISLVTSIYKVLAKFLASSLKFVLEEVVEAHHCAFVRGRNIHDCVFIANECVEDHLFQKKQGIVVKLD